MSSALPRAIRPGGIDQADFGDAVAHRQRVRDGAAERAAADDRDETHQDSTILVAMDTASQTTPDAGRDCATVAAVITGGSRGIGRAIAAALASPRRPRRHHRARASATCDAAAAAAAGTQSTPVRADVSKPDEAAARDRRRRSQTFGGLDVLVNNAGVGLFANVADMSIDAAGTRSSART